MTAVTIPDALDERVEEEWLANSTEDSLEERAYSPEPTASLEEQGYIGRAVELFLGLFPQYRIMKTKLEEAKTETRRLQRMSYIDRRTGVLSSDYIEDEFKTRIADEGSTVLVLDIDHFGRFNKKYGVAAGDQYVRAVPQAAKEVLRTGDEIMRYGGEEFLVYLPDTNLKHAAIVADRLREHVRDNVKDPEGEPVTVSMGAAYFDKGAESVEEVIQNASLAVIHSKEHGRDRLSIYEGPNQMRVYQKVS